MSSAFEIIDLTQDIDYIDLTQSNDLTDEEEHLENEIIHIPVVNEHSVSLSPPNLTSLEETGKRWYDDPNADHPFELSLKGKPEQSTSDVTFTEAAFFPWDSTVPIEKLWNDDPYISRSLAKSVWETIASKWSHCVAMCGGRLVRIVQTYPFGSRADIVLQINLPYTSPHTIEHLTWALDPWTLHPLLIFVHSSVLHVFDLELRESLGWLKGHGGNITSIGTNIHYPHLVYTTSRDCTVRIYDFRWTSEKWRLSLKRTNGVEDTLDPFKIKIPNEESELGRCVTILTGGRSGGHEAAVLGASFHPSLPLLATCGVDHAIRIWYLSPTLFQKSRFLDPFTTKVFREDKPLFSSTALHDGRVLSVHWLSDDILISNSAPPYQIAEGDGQEKFGRMVVWRWLSIKRFFPAEQIVPPDPPLRGCISDYRESCKSVELDFHSTNTNAAGQLEASLKIISLVKLAEHTTRIRISRNGLGPPLLLLPHHSHVIITNPCHLPLRPRPPFLHHGVLRSNNWLDGIPEVEGWVLNNVLGENLEDEHVLACAMSPDGLIVAGIGENEILWIWSRKKT